MTHETASTFPKNSPTALAGGTGASNVQFTLRRRLIRLRSSIRRSPDTGGGSSRSRRSRQRQSGDLETRRASRAAGRGVWSTCGAFHSPFAPVQWSSRRGGVAPPAYPTRRSGVGTSRLRGPHHPPGEALAAFGLNPAKSGRHVGAPPAGGANPHAWTFACDLPPTSSPPCPPTDQRSDRRGRRWPSGCGQAWSTTTQPRT